MFRVRNFDNISGFQFSLQWDPTIAEVIMEESASGQLQPSVTDSALISIGEVSLPMIGGNNFSSMAPEWPGVMVSLWDEAIQPDLGRTLEDDAILFALPSSLLENPVPRLRSQLGTFLLHSRSFQRMTQISLRRLKMPV